MATRRRLETMEENRGKLIAAGRRAFASEGFAAASMDELTASVGLTRGALYHHFRDKRDLFEAVVEEVSRGIATTIDDVTAPVSDPLEMLVEGARAFLAAETTHYQYVVGAKDESAISPDNWTHDQPLLDRPGTDAYQLDLLYDYRNNVALYDSWHAAFRQYHPKTLIVWGNKDPFFIPAGAEAFKRDLPDAKLVWLDSGHFVLDENAPKVAGEIKGFFTAR